MKKALIFAVLGTVLQLSPLNIYAQWQRTNGPYGGQATCIASDGANIYAGSSGGVFLSNNNGSSWKSVNNGLTNTDVQSLAISGINIFAGTSGGVYLSTDQGSSWVGVNTGLTNQIVKSMAISGTNIFAGTWGGMYLSTDNGNNWTAINNGLPANTIVESIAITGTNIYIGAFQGGVFLSTNNGSTWTAVKNGLPTNPVVLSLAISGTNMFAGTSDGVFLSTNYGDSWTAASSGLLNSFVRTIAISGKNIFAGTDGGIFLSTNNGSTWVLANSGFPTAIVNVLTVFGDDIFAGTNGAGVWYRPVSDFTDNGISKPLSAGWTWFSLNATNTDMSTAAVLGNLKSTEGDYIKNQTVSATYYDGAGWFGELMEINPVEMYKIKLAKADTLIFDGITVDPLTNPVTIKSGWNWIGYLPQLPQSVSVSLSGISPVADDYIKNQTKSSTFYDEAGWFGELTNLEPLDGYMMKTSHAGSMIFPSIIPTVTTSDISAITRIKATSGGTVTSEGTSLVTASGVCWSTTASPTEANSKTTDGAGLGTFTSTLSVLAASTTYYVRAYATNSAGTGYGEEKSFTTSPNIPIVGEYKIDGENITIPNATIFTNGSSFTDTVQIPKGEICTVIQGDSVFFVYNNGIDTISPLNRDNSDASFFRLMFGESKDEGEQLKSGSGIVLQTGVKMEPAGEGTYQFTNLSARWVGVQVDNQPSFLLEAKNILPELSIGSLTQELVGLAVKKEPILVEHCVYTIGSPARAYITNAGLFSLLLNSDVTKSFQAAKLKNPELARKVVTADIVSMVVTGARKVLKTVLGPTGGCNDLIVDAGIISPIETIAWALINSDNLSDYDDSKKQVYKESARVAGDLVSCMIQLACTGSTAGGCQVASGIAKTIIEIYNLAIFGANLVVGSIEASTLPAYGEYCLNGLDGTFTDSRDGHNYAYKTIGTQTWMAENLAYLPAVNLSSAWSYTIPYYYVYGYEGNNVNSAKAEDNYLTYGVLYNWAAALTACPSGWHLPNDEEWKTLEKNQGMSNSDADLYGFRSSGNVGFKLKEVGTLHWLSPNNGANNSSGFSAFGGGLNNGGFKSIGHTAEFWTSSEYNSVNGWIRGTFLNYEGLYRVGTGKSNGPSIRCVKD